MEGSPLTSRCRNEPEFTMLEWDLKSRISRQNNRSRRFSGSYVRSFREESNRSFRSSINTISSTASSPGCNVKYEIDPSTYSFTTALKALQARSGSIWECHSPDGFALNSKWNEAERYICNPLSGQVPVECLSSNALSKRPFHNLVARRITMSAPLVYSSRRFSNCPKPPLVVKEKDEDQKTTTKSKNHLTIQEKEMLRGCRTRDVGTQSNPPDPPLLRTSSCSSSPIPPVQEVELKHCEPEAGKLPSSKLHSMEEVEVVKATREEEDTKRDTYQDQERNKKKKKKKQITGAVQLCRCSRQSGCLLSWTSLWMRKRHREKHKPRTKSTHSSILPIYTC